MMTRLPSRIVTFLKFAIILVFSFDIVIGAAMLLVIQHDKEQRLQALRRFRNNSKVLSSKIRVTTIPTATKVSTPTLIPTLIPTRVYATRDPDPYINCGPFPKSKITLTLRKSTCLQYTDCGFLSGKWIPMLKSDCGKKQAEEIALLTALQTKTNRSAPSYPTVNPNPKINCAYTSYNGKYYFDFGELTFEDCKVKSDAYWDSINTRQTATSTSIPTPTKKVDEATCRQQYQIETQNANVLLSGSAREAALEIAKQSLTRCLSTGSVEINTIQKAPTPTKVDSSYYGGHY